MKTIMKKLLLAFCVLFSVLGNAQTWKSIYPPDSLAELPTHDVFTMAKDIDGAVWFGTNNGVSCFKNGKWKIYTKKDGLSSDTINAISIDKLGTKWFATTSGITSYKNNIFKIYNSNNSILDNLIFDIEVDYNNIKWIAGSKKKLVSFNDTIFVEHKINGLYQVNSIGIDTLNNLWLATKGGGLCKYNGNSSILYQEYLKLGTLDIDPVVSDKKNNIYLGAGGITKYNGTKWSRFLSYQINVTDMALDKNDSLWVSSTSGVIKQNKSGFDFFPRTPVDYVNLGWTNSIIFDYKNNFWVGNSECLYMFDGKKWNRFNSTPKTIKKTKAILYTNESLILGTPAGLITLKNNNWSLLNSNNSYLNSEINCIINDENSYWIGTKGEGIYYVKNNVVQNFSKTDGLANNNVNFMIKDDSSNVWAATYGGGVSKFNGTKWETYTTTNELASNYVFSISIDSKGYKWFGTDNGVSRFDNKQWKSYKVIDGLSNNSVRSIAIDSKGNKWFGTNGGGVSKFNDTTWITYSVNDGLVFNSVNAIAIDSKGNKWFGTNGGGVSKFNDTTWTTYSVNNGLVNNIVYTISIDSMGNKWFARIQLKNKNSL